MVTNDKIADVMNINGITFKVISALKNKSKTNICSFKVFHKLNTKIKPPETIEAKNKYILCILCNIPFIIITKIALLF